MKNVTKKLCAILLLAAAAAGISACGGSNKPEDTKKGDESSTETSEIAMKFEKDNLPSDLDFQKQEVTWLIGNYYGAYEDDFASENDGTRITDAIFRARKNVEERLNVQFDYEVETFDWDHRAVIGERVQRSVMANDQSFDVYVGYPILNLMLSGDYLLDMRDTKYINFDKPWWSSGLLEIMPGNAVYMASGDGSLSLIKHTYCMYFNEDLLKANDINDDLYALVWNHKWTIDKLREYAVLGYSNLNGDDTSNYGDQFGLTFGDGNKYQAFHLGSNGVGVRLTDKGYEVLYDSAHQSDIFDKLYDLINNTVGVLPTVANEDNDIHISSGGGNYADLTFIEKHAFFTVGLFCDAPVTLGEADFNYGVLPIPMFDENQEDYYSAAQRTAYFSIPTTSDPDICSAVLEAWSSEAYRTIMPEYFEVTLKTRYSTDNEMVKVFDLIRSNVRFEIMEIFSDLLDYPTAPFVNMILHKEEGFASRIASNVSAWQEQLDRIYESLQ